MGVRMSSSAAAKPAPGAPPELPRALVATYCLPMLGVNFAMVLVIAYITKYSIDVLLIAPATVGFIFGLGRIWDAISDPLVGYWTDRTTTRFGRRRPWLIGALVPFVVFTWMCWSPPESLTGTGLVIWMVIAIFGFNTASTLFLVPHQALGAEISTSGHGRTQLFGARQLVATVGSALALVLGTGAINGAENPREVATWIALATIVACILTIVPSTIALRERPDYQGRGGKSPFTAFGDVLRNPHARLLLGMIFIEHMGSGASMVLSPFFMDYIIGMPRGIGVIYLFYTGTQLAVIPLWVRLARSIGKKNTWMTGLVVAVVGYSLLYGFVGEGDLYLMCFVVVLTGAASACGTVIGSSILADVIDWDELETGERKEGTYYSGYALLYKGSSGIMAMLAGWALAASGFEPNQVQSEDTQYVIRSLMTLVPGGCTLFGLFILSRFRLTESAHADVQAQLEARRQQSADSAQ